MQRAPFKVRGEGSLDGTVPGKVDAGIAAEARTSSKFLKTLRPVDPWSSLSYVLLAESQHEEWNLLHRPSGREAFKKATLNTNKHQRW